MTTKYKLTQVAPIHGGNFTKGNINLGENLSLEVATRIGHALVKAGDDFASPWVEVAGCWSKGNKPVIVCEEMPRRDDIGYLEEALNITGGGGDRETDYGHPISNFSAIAVLWTVWLKLRGKLMPIHNLDNEDVAMLNILQKIAREGNAPKRDNWVDMAGYVNTASRMNDITKEERDRKASEKGDNGKWYPSLEKLLSWIGRR